MVLPTAPQTTPPAVVDSVPNLTQEWVVKGKDPNLVIGQKDSFGTLWWWTDLDGYFATPAMSTPIAPLGSLDRSVAASRFPRKERYVTIEGVGHVSSHSQLWSARERLITAFDSPNDDFDLIVMEPTTPKRLLVRSAGPVDVGWFKEADLWFEFSIPLVALNPYKMGLDIISASIDPPTTSVVVNNPGNAETWPQFSLRGFTSTNWNITNTTTGVVSKWDTSVATNAILLINPDEQRVTLDGNNITVKRTGDWIYLVPGNNTITFTPVSADTATLLSISAYAQWK